MRTRRAKARRCHLTTGGTSRFFPALAVREKIAGRGWDVFWLGIADGMEAALYPEAWVRDGVGQVPRCAARDFKTLVLSPFALVAACVEALSAIRRRLIPMSFWPRRLSIVPGRLMASLTGPAARPA